METLKKRASSRQVTVNAPLLPGIQLHSANSNSLSKFKLTATNPNSLRQIQIQEGKFKFTTSNTPQQIQIHHGNFKFTAAISNSPRQSQITTANSDSLQQIIVYHSKFKFSTANSNCFAGSSPLQIQFTVANLTSLSKFKFTAIISNSPRQIQCGKFN